MPQPSHLLSRKAKKSWQGMEADPDNPGRWVCFYLQKHDRVIYWWREFWSLLCSTDECLGDVQVQELACQQAVAFRLPATQWEKDGSWTSPPCLGVKVLPSPKRLQGNLRLSSSADWRNDGAGHGAPEACHPFWNAPRGALWGSARAPQMPHPHGWEWQPIWPQDVGCGEGTHDPSLWRKSPITNTQRRTNNVTVPSELTTSKPEETAQSEEFALVSI